MSNLPTEAGAFTAHVDNVMAKARQRFHGQRYRVGSELHLLEMFVTIVDKLRQPAEPRAQQPDAVKAHVVPPAALRAAQGVEAFACWQYTAEGEIYWRDVYRALCRYSDMPTTPPTKVEKL